MRNPTAQGNLSSVTIDVTQGCGGKEEEPMSVTAVVGIDVSKATLACTMVDARTRRAIWQEEVPNTPVGVATALGKTPMDAPWIVEPTGKYGLLAVRLATQAGRDVRLAPPRKAKAYLASLQDRAKTDRVDSQGLALFGLSCSVTVPLQTYAIKDQAVEQLEELLSARKGLSRARAMLQLQASELPYAREALEGAITALNGQIEALDKQIAGKVKNDPKFATAQRLIKVPGIGPVTAAAISARLSSKQFSHPDKFVAYIGLDVGVRESGKRKGKRGLTHQGDGELRRLLFVCAQASLRANNSPFKGQYERERAKGLSSTAALCAVARKMACLCWSMHKRGTAYNPARVYQHPRDLALSSASAEETSL